MEAPRRACCLTLKLEADDPASLASALMNMSLQIDRGQLSTGVSGGPSSGCIYELSLADTPTHDEYFVQLRAYLDAKAKPAA